MKVFFPPPGLSVSDTQLHLKGRCNKRDHCIDRNLAMLQRNILKIFGSKLERCECRSFTARDWPGLWVQGWWWDYNEIDCWKLKYVNEQTIVSSKFIYLFFIGKQTSKNNEVICYLHCIKPIIVFWTPKYWSRVFTRVTQQTADFIMGVYVCACVCMGMCVLCMMCVHVWYMHISVFLLVYTDLWMTNTKSLPQLLS